MKQERTCNCKTKAHSSHLVEGIALGTLVGLVLSALFISPNKEDNKKKLKTATDNTLDKSKELYEIIQKDVLPALEQLKPLIEKGADVAKPIAKQTASKITHLSDVSLDSIEKRMKKLNNNAAKRKYFRGNF